MLAAQAAWSCATSSLISLSVWSSAECVDVLVQRGADAADLAIADPQPEALHELVDAAGRDAANIGLLDDGQQRLLGTPRGSRNDGK
jgi:hypothetical protein